jgi:hypothetical protein
MILETSAPTGCGKGYLKELDDTRQAFRWRLDFRSAIIPVRASSDNRTSTTQTFLKVQAREGGQVNPSDAVRWPRSPP